MLATATALTPATGAERACGSRRCNSKRCRRRWDPTEDAQHRYDARSLAQQALYSGTIVWAKVEGLHDWWPKVVRRCPRDDVGYLPEPSTLSTLSVVFMNKFGIPGGARPTSGWLALRAGPGGGVGNIVLCSMSQGPDVLRAVQSTSLANVVLLLLPIQRSTNTERVYFLHERSQMESNVPKQVWGDILALVLLSFTAFMNYAPQLQPVPATCTVDNRRKFAQCRSRRLDGHQGALASSLREHTRWPWGRGTGGRVRLGASSCSPCRGQPRARGVRWQPTGSCASACVPRSACSEHAT
jgi:hypothetical protein